MDLSARFIANIFNVRKVCFSSHTSGIFQYSQLLGTLEDDLIGTSAGDIQVKCLNNRKAYREGHSADAVSDALGRVVLTFRFKRRGEGAI